MIELIGLNGVTLYLNYFQILCIELIPETKIIMTNGHYYLVKDSIKAVEYKIASFLHSCIDLDSRQLTAPEGAPVYRPD